MTLLIFFAGALFTIFTLYLMIAPFIGAERGLRLEHLDEEVREIEQLVARRQVLLTSLRELDFDRETDKIATEDYERFRRRYEAEAVAVMRRLDEIHGGRDWQNRVDEELTERLGHPPQIRGAVDDEAGEADERQEEVEALESASDSEPDAANDDAVEAAADEEEAAEVPEQTAEDAEASEEEPADDDGAMVVDLDDAPQLRCVSCDSLLATDDKFCSQCGTPVTPSKADESAKSEASA